MNRKIMAALAGVAAFGTAFSFAPAAQADPNPATDYRTYAAVGSDTTQDVWNGLANGNPAAGLPQAIAGIASWDAFGTPTIKTKSRGNAFARPAGSGAGQKALSRSWDPTGAPTNPDGAYIWNGVNIKGQVDFARSSSGPSVQCAAVTDANCMLLFLPMARDAISVAVQTGKGDTVQVNVTRQQLIDAYSCAAPLTVSLSDGTSQVVNPLLPQLAPAPVRPS